MRIVRLAATAVGAVVLSTVLATAAHAADGYPPVGPPLEVSATTVADHGTVTIHGHGFEPNETIDIKESVKNTAAAAPHVQFAPAAYRVPTGIGMPVDAKLLKKVKADNGGDFTTTLQLNDPGIVTIMAIGEISGEVETVVETVLAPSSGGGNGGGSGSGGSGSGGGLPKTGSDFGEYIAIGGGLVGAGLVLVLGTMMWRRRRGVAAV